MEVGKEFLHYCTWPNLNIVFFLLKLLMLICALVGPDIDICPGSKKFFTSFGRGNGLKDKDFSSNKKWPNGLVAVALLFMGSAFPPDRPCSWWPVGVSKPWRQVSHHWSPLKKRGSQKNHVVCLLVFYSICVLIFGVFTVHHFIPKFKRRGILTEAFHFYTSDKT